MIADLDVIDLQILHLLQHDARLTTKELAGKLGKAVTSVHDRIRKLEDEGYIERYVALLNKEQIGKNLIGYTTVRLKEHSQAALRGFEREVVKFHEVMECYQLTGQADFLIKVAVRDMEEYNTYLMQKLATLPNIGTVETSFVLSEGKRETAYHLVAETGKKKAKK